MDLMTHFATLARYNRIANERLYERCAVLSETDYKRKWAVSFGSVHALLNHMLLADEIWTARFVGEGKTTPPLDTVLAESFEQLRSLREAKDGQIEDFFAGVGPEFFQRKLQYTNSRGIACSDDAAMAASHFFNHQTHHRGQVHALLSLSSVQPPSLDLHRIINP